MYQLNFNSPIPIYEQIVRQAHFLIASGALPEDELIPSVREVAKSLTINPQTVVRAYTELKAADLIVAVRGQGYAVKSGARDRCRRARLELFQTRIEEGIEEAALGRLSPQEIAEIVDAAYVKVVAKHYPDWKPKSVKLAEQSNDVAKENYHV